MLRNRGICPDFDGTNVLFMVFVVKLEPVEIICLTHAERRKWQVPSG
jgi:hypothetical protein